MTQKITPNLWFNGNAKEAADFYAATFPNTTSTVTSSYPNSTDEGLADFQKDLASKELTVDFKIGDYNFTCINAGPEFTVNPSISFLVNFDPSQDGQAREHLDELWNKLIEGGNARIDIGEHPFSKRYGWVEDKFGVSWQLMLTNPEGEPRPFIVPSFLFTKQQTNHAEEAINYYTALFEDSKTGTLVRYPEDQGPAKKDSIMFADFMLNGQWFAAMDAPIEQDFIFNEGVSLSVVCKDQAEIDYFWEKLSTVPEAEQCGWCKDQFGVSWQIVPENMEELMRRPNAFANMMQMHKLIIDEF